MTNSDRSKTNFAARVPRHLYSAHTVGLVHHDPPDELNMVVQYGQQAF
jgi:hypothetical protein